MLNAASVPHEAGSGIDCMRPRHRERTEEALALRDSGRAITTPTDPPDRDQLRHGYGTELDATQIDCARDRVRFVRDSFNFFDAPVSWSRASTVPVTYVENLRDRSVPLALQREMIARLPVPPVVVPLDTSHVPAVTMPAVLQSSRCELPQSERCHLHGVPNRRSRAVYGTPRAGPGGAELRPIQGLSTRLGRAIWSSPSLSVDISVYSAKCERYRFSTAVHYSASSMPNVATEGWTGTLFPTHCGSSLHNSTHSEMIIRYAQEPL